MPYEILPPEPNVEADVEAERGAFEGVSDAVADASPHMDHFTLAHAIVDGLGEWPGSQVKNIMKLLEALAYHSGEPVTIHNRADEH